jgi:hypothetical protein
MVSSGGGSEPVWSRDGQRLFYRGESQLIAATIRPGPSFSVASRDTVVREPFVYATNPHANYDVMPNGRQFIFLKAISEGELIAVTNWKDELRAKMRSAGTR